MTTETKTLILTKVFAQLNDAWYGGKRRFFVEGGTASSKTYSVMQFLKLLLENYPEPIIATVTSESVPHLKRGPIRDFLSIMGDELIDNCWNRSDFIYTFPKSGCKLEFVSDDYPGKWLGGRREIWFLNELNNIHKRSYMEGDLRTRLFTIGDWNPYGEFWFHDDKIADHEENVFISGMTFRDVPEVASGSVIATIESYKDTDPNYYRVHWLGLLGNIEGLVYPNFEQVDELPKGDYFYGLDYGFSVDPTVLVKNVILGDKLYSEEMFYSREALTNDQIAREMSLLKIKEPIYPDPDEPKSAAEISKEGFNVIEAVKGKGSVEFGVQKVNQYYQHWTKGSLSCIKDQRNFRYIEDKLHPGRFTDKTTHRWSHGMDARRYAVASYKGWQSSHSGILQVRW